MKKLTLLLFFIFGLSYGQEVIKDSLLSKGRYVEIKANRHLLKINAPFYINPFKVKNGILTSDSRPYIGVMFEPYDFNSEVILQDLINDPSFIKENPTAEFIPKDVYSIRYWSVFTDKANKKIAMFTRMYAVRGGILYFVFNIVLEKRTPKQAEDEVVDFMKYITLEQNHFSA